MSLELNALGLLSFSVSGDVFEIALWSLDMVHSLVCMSVCAHVCGKREKKNPEHAMIERFPLNSWCFCCGALISAFELCVCFFCVVANTSFYFFNSIQKS